MSPSLRALVVRDLRLAAGDRETTLVTTAFVVAAVLLSGLAFGPEPAILHRVGPGLVWLVVLLSVAPLAREVAAADREEGAWDVLRAVASPTHLLVAKAATLWLRLLVTWAGVLLLVAAVFDVTVPGRAWPAGVLATLGLAVLTVVPGVVVAGGRGSGGSALLTALLLPLSLPVLLAGTMLTTKGLPTGPWFLVLAGFDALLIVVVWASFPTLLEE